MELNHDWRSFHSMFYPRRRSFMSRANAAPNGPIYVLADQGQVIMSFAEGEDVSEWNASPLEEMVSKLAHRKVVQIERAQVDEWMKNALALPHFYEQMEYLKEKAVPENGTVPQPPKHFMLEALDSWWSKVLPSAYGIFIRVEGQPAQDFFMVVRRGRIDAFHEPDLSAMGNDRARQAGDVVKYLSEKHLVPVQGLFLSAQEWADWNESGQPWKKVATSIRENRAKLVPFRWSLVSLVATRGFFRV